MDWSLIGQMKQETAELIQRWRDRGIATSAILQRLEAAQAEVVREKHAKAREEEAEKEESANQREKGEDGVHELG